MDRQMKRRPKSAPVITDAYFQNKREEECLCMKLDGIHYQHHADLTRLRQATGHVVRQQQHLLSQRAVTPQSTLQHIMEEIQTFKKDKLCTVKTTACLPASTELVVGTKWLPSPSSQSLKVSSDLHENGGSKRFSQTAVQRDFSVADTIRMRPGETVWKSLDTSESHTARKPRATSGLQRKSTSCMELLTYRELGGIARLDNIYTREAEKQRQQQLLERQRLHKSLDAALQQRVHHFLKKSS
ncbi:hypothetical protein FKM82_011301 [Ascaphus truei]